MKNVSVARRYARALFELGQEDKSLSDISQALTNLSHAVGSDESVHRYFMNPIVKPEEKREVASKVTSNKLVLRFIELLAKKKRLDLIGVVSDEFQRFKDQSEGVNRISVGTATPLSESQRKLVEENLAKQIGGKITSRFFIQEDLIGGLLVKMGDKVWDATVRGQFEDLRHTLLHSTN